MVLQHLFLLVYLLLFTPSFLCCKVIITIIIIINNKIVLAYCLRAYESAAKPFFCLILDKWPKKMIWYVQLCSVMVGCDQ